MGQRVTIDFGPGGLSISGDPFEQQPKKSLDEISDNNDDPLLNFLKEEVKVDENSDEFKIPDDAPIKQAERIAKYRGGKIEDYLKLHPRDLWQLDMEVKREHPVEPIKQGQELRDNKYYEKKYYKEQKDIFDQKLPGTLY